MMLTEASACTTASDFAGLAADLCELKFQKSFCDGKPLDDFDLFIAGVGVGVGLKALNIITPGLEYGVDQGVSKAIKYVKKF